MHPNRFLPLAALPALVLLASGPEAAAAPRPIDTKRTGGARPGGADEAGREGRAKEARPALDRGGPEKRLSEVIEEGKANLREIQKLLDEIEKNLATKATGAPTQEKQARVVKKLDELLQELEKQCSKCSSSNAGSGGGSKEKQRAAEEERKGKEEKEEPRRPDKSEAELPENRDQRDSDRERNDGEVENDRAEDASAPEAKADALRRQLLEISRRWGILPPKLREEAMFSTGREAPREYLEIISRYYRRLSEFYESSQR